MMFEKEFLSYFLTKFLFFLSIALTTNITLSNVIMVVTDIFEEIKNNFVSEIGDKYSVEAIFEVWKNITKLICRYLQHNKSLSLKNIGLFTLGKWSLETGIRRELNHFEPVFKLSRTLLEHFDLHQTKQYSDDKVPIAPVNYCSLAYECNIDKECVLYALQAITETLWKVLYRNDDVKLDFPDLGTLYIKNQIVKFTFTKEIVPATLEPPKICYRFNAADNKYNAQETFPYSFSTDFHTLFSTCCTIWKNPQESIGGSTDDSMYIKILPSDLEQASKLRFIIIYVLYIFSLNNLRFQQ